MRTKKRMTKFLIAAVAVSVLGAVAPASAGCARVKVYVQQGSSAPTQVGSDNCATPDIPPFGGSVGADQDDSITILGDTTVHYGYAVAVPAPI